MAHFLYSFRLELLRRSRAKGSILFLVLALLLSVCVVLAPNSKDAMIEVGLVLPPSGEALEELILERSSQLVRFIPTDEETLDKKVLTGQWDCGLVAHRDFAEKLEELDTKSLFILKTGPGSTVYPLIRETVAACVIELTAPEVAREYLVEKGVDPSTLDQRLKALEASAQRVEVVLQTLEGDELEPLDLTASGIRRLLRGLTAVLAMLWGLYLTGDLGRFLSSDTGIRLRTLRSATALLLPRLCAALLPVLLWGCALLGWLDGWRAALCFLPFLGVVLGLGLTVPRCKGLWQSVICVIPFLVLGSLLLEPVLIDVQSLFPRLAPWLGWLPVTLFCRGCDGQLSACLWLLLETGILAGISLLLDARKIRTT